MRDRVLPQIRQCVILCQKGDARFALTLFGGKCGGQAGGVFAYRKSVFLQKVFKGRSALGFLPRCFGVGKNGIGKPVDLSLILLQPLCDPIGHRISPGFPLRLVEVQILQRQNCLGITAAEPAGQIKQGGIRNIIACGFSQLLAQNAAAGDP